MSAHRESVALREDGAAVRITDQTLLPHTFATVDLSTREDMEDAICTLKVRGAPALGVAAAWCYYVLARHAARDAQDASSLRAALADNGSFLTATRPTAVNLPRAIERMEQVANSFAHAKPDTLLAALEEEARAIQNETVAASNEIARLGAGLLENGWGVITHCNAGPLAALGYGTGQGPLFYAHDHGMKLSVFVDETRPLLQGARLTAYELCQAGIDATLICDNMAATLMAAGRVQACMVGCDRVAANGDVANKVGTLGLAVLAAHYGVPFYVLGPVSTIDLSCPTGSAIPIELRDEAEIKSFHYCQPLAPGDIACFNPSFDVTGHELVSAIVTERGICRPPYSESLAACLPYSTT